MVSDRLEWSTSSITVAGGGVKFRRRGAGRPLVVLHRDIGTPDRLPFYDLLSAHFDVIVPDHPGFGKSEQPSWMRNVRDIAVAYRSMLGELAIDRPLILGLGFGGWIGAELATFDPFAGAPLALVGAMGLKPPTGEILDQALVNYVDYVKLGFSDPDGFRRMFGERPSSEQLVDWDVCREMCFRVAWRPYMYSDTLPFLLGGIRAPSLVVWGEDDAIVPPSAGRLYAEKLRASQLEIIPGAGHLIEMEQPARLAELIVPFFTRRQ